MGWGWRRDWGGLADLPIKHIEFPTTTERGATVYYHRPGTGAGATKWLIYYEGGGWCASTQECYDRSVFWMWVWGCAGGLVECSAIRPSTLSLPTPSDPTYTRPLLFSQRTHQIPDRPGQLAGVRQGQALGVGHAHLGPHQEPAAARASCCCVLLFLHQSVIVCPPQPVCLTNLSISQTLSPHKIPELARRLREILRRYESLPCIPTFGGWGGAWPTSDLTSITNHQPHFTILIAPGGFFSSDRMDTEVHRGKTLYYRGKYIQEAIFRDLRANRFVCVYVGVSG